MAEHSADHDSPISDSLHPFVNIAIIGLVLMFVAAMWTFFASDPYGEWLDVVVTGLFVIAIAIPALLWLTWRRNADGAHARPLRCRPTQNYHNAASSTANRFAASYRE